jgi:hypothetical protein
VRRIILLLLAPCWRKLNRKCQFSSGCPLKLDFMVWLLLFGEICENKKIEEKTNKQKTKKLEDNKIVEHFYIGV